MIKRSQKSYLISAYIECYKSILQFTFVFYHAKNILRWLNNIPSRCITAFILFLESLLSLIKGFDIAAIFCIVQCLHVNSFSIIWKVTYPGFSFSRTLDSLPWNLKKHLAEYCFIMPECNIRKYTENIEYLSSIRHFWHPFT